MKNSKICTYLKQNLDLNYEDLACSLQTFYYYLSETRFFKFRWQYPEHFENCKITKTTFVKFQIKILQIACSKDSSLDDCTFKIFKDRLPKMFVKICNF